MYELRASELGRCTKASAAILLGYAPLPTPDKVQGWYDRGNELEPRCIEALGQWFVITHELPGFEVDEEQVYVRLEFAGATVTGHLDGIAHDMVGEGSLAQPTRVLEVKSLVAFNNFEKAVKTNDWSDPYMHRLGYQASVYGHATDLEVMVATLDENGVLSFVIEVPPFTLQQIEQRVGEIIGYTEGGLPGSCSQNDWPCPVAYLHETPEVEEDEHLDVLVGQYGEFGAIIKAATESQKKVQTEIRQYLAGTDRTTAASKVTFYEQKGVTKWDDVEVETFLMGHGQEPHDFRVTGKPSQRMKITKRGSDEPQEASGD